MFAELPAVILDVVHLVVTQTQDLEGHQSVKPALIDRHDLSGIKKLQNVNVFMLNVTVTLSPDFCPKIAAQWIQDRKMPRHPNISNYFSSI